MKNTTKNMRICTGKKLKLFPVILVIVLSIISNPVLSQKEAMDLSIIPLTPDTTVLGDSTKLMIQFKTNQPDSIQNIDMKFGTVQDSADVAVINPTIIYSNTKYYIDLNGDLNEIEDYEARVFCTLSEAQMTDYNYMTLIVAYIDGTSDILYWLKKTQIP